MLQVLLRLFGNRKGATAIEYGLMAAFIAIALVAALPSIHENLRGVFNDVGTPF